MLIKKYTEKCQVVFILKMGLCFPWRFHTSVYWKIWYFSEKNLRPLTSNSPLTPDTGMTTLSSAPLFTNVDGCFENSNSQHSGETSNLSPLINHLPCWCHQAGAQGYSHFFWITLNRGVHPFKLEACNSQLQESTKKSWSPFSFFTST